MVPAALRERALCRQNQEVTVRTLVLSPQENRAVFDTTLDRKGIQPVWLEIENRSPQTLWFMPVGLDRDYYPPLEVAYRSHRAGATTRRQMDAYFCTNTLPLALRPGTTNAGFAFGQILRGAKAFNVELLGTSNLLSFAFVQAVPGFKADFSRVALDRLADPALARQCNRAELRAELETLPAHSTDAQGTEPGDPINLVIVGSLDNVLESFVRGGWRLTEPLTTGSSWRLFKRYLLGQPYPTAPVSSLYLFGRKQDLALQRPRQSMKQRNHLRLWLTPLRCAGVPVWAGQISRDVGVRFTLRTWHLSTHAIAPDVDETRDALMGDLLTSQVLAEVGWVKGVGPAPASAPRRNLTHDPFYTDGLRIVLFLASEARAADELNRLNWETPPAP
jgi:hypothetical protein